MLLIMLAVGASFGLAIGTQIPLPDRKRGMPAGPLSSKGFFAGAVAAIGGVVVGFMAPVFILGALRIGTGSYEDVLFIWPVSIPMLALGAGLVATRLVDG